MDKVRDVFLYFVAAMAMFSLLLAIYQAMNRSLSSAAILAGIFLASTLVVFIPQLEVIKAWGVEGKLRQSLDRAEEIIGRLKGLSVISARVSYLTIAWGNRLGSPKAKEKQAVLDEVDKQLADLKVSPDERAIIIKPYVQMIGLDFYYHYKAIINSYAAARYSALIARRTASQNSDDLRASFEHSDGITAWTKRTAADNDPFLRLSTYSFEDELNKVTPMPSEWLNERELIVLEGFKQQLIELFARCRKKGGYTPEAAEYYDKYIADTDAKATELFKQVLADMK